MRGNDCREWARDFEDAVLQGADARNSHMRPSSIFPPTRKFGHGRRTVVDRRGARMRIVLLVRKLRQPTPAKGTREHSDRVSALNARVGRGTP